MNKREFMGTAALAGAVPMFGQAQPSGVKVRSMATR
jgi:hypothetical protein